MSSFVVDPTNLRHACAAYLCRFERDSYIAPSSVRDAFAALGISDTRQSVFTRADKLARVLWIANHRAVRNRYRHHGMKSGFAPILKISRSRCPSMKDIQLYKSCGCLLYQCEEYAPGTEPDTLKLLRAAYDTLAHYAARKHPDYEAATWG